MNNWIPIVKSRVINMPHFLDVIVRFNDPGFDTVVVAEIREGNEYFLKHYWVHCSTHIDVIVYKDDIKGKGSKKYKDKILEIVEIFKLDGLDPKKTVQYPPRIGNYYNNPAVIYDSRDYYLLGFGNLDELEDKLNRRYDFVKLDKEGELLKVPLEHACILEIPINQDLVYDLYHFKEKALKQFIDKQFDQMF